MPSTTSYNPSYRYGETMPVQIPFYTGTAAAAALGSAVPSWPVNVGDLCFCSGPTRTVADGATTISTPTLTSATALFTPGDVGATVAATGIPAGTKILSVQSSTSVTMTANATATGSALSLTITPVQGISVFPAMAYPWTTNLATTQANFVKQFIGVAAQQFDGVNTNAYGIQDGNVRIDTAAFFDFVCASQTWNVGDLVGPDQDGSNLALFAQRVVNNNAHPNGIGGAIGRVVAPFSTPTTLVRAQIFPAYMNLPNAGAI